MVLAIGRSETDGEINGAGSGLGLVMVRTKGGYQKTLTLRNRGRAVSLQLDRLPIDFAQSAEGVGGQPQARSAKNAVSPSVPRIIRAIW